ncbi:hypothetical protein [Oryzifoliimicrobium ureilyticus]|uniref:hypothetical protein n=1 Tax=Oryzifoliimicrobium ureilyticus TaxID=3113724 RepID=UPI0030765CFC
MFRDYLVTVQIDDGSEVRFNLNEVQACEIIWANPGATVVLDKVRSISVGVNEYELTRPENGQMRAHRLPQRQTYQAITEMVKQASEDRRRGLSLKGKKSQWSGPSS